MALTIVATVGSASANSFATEVEFIGYAAARLNVPSGTTATGSVCTETEKKALIEATRQLTLLRWKGWRIDETQALSWPRTYVVDPDTPVASAGDTTYPYFADTVIPIRVKDATIEWALEFLKAGTTDIAAASPEHGLIEKKIDVLEWKWDGAASRAEGLTKYPRIGALIAPLVEAVGGLEVVRT